MPRFNYFKYTIKQDTTVEELVSGASEGGVFKNYNKTDLLNVTVCSTDYSNYDKEIYNIDRIWNNYTEEQQKEYDEDYNQSGLLSVVNKGTVLVIEKGKAPLDVVALIGENIFLEQNDIDGFWSKNYKAIHNNEGNVRTDKTFEEDYVKLKNYNISVWVYIRALDEIKDVTDFIFSASTNSNMSGGGFNLSLDSFGGFKNVHDQKGEYLCHYNYADGDKFNIPYFLKYLQQKDVVFIKFETLEMEGNSRISKKDSNFTVQPSELPSMGYDKDTETFDKPRVYDMIGLVEDVHESYSSGSGDVTVTVTGKDLLGLLSDDASYFYPLMFVEDSDLLMFDSNDDSRWFKRTFIKGNFENLFVFKFRKIRESIGFVINQLSNLGVVPNELFRHYNEANNETEKDQVSIRDRRSKIVRINGDNVDRDSEGKEVVPYIKWSEVNGIWQIIDIAVDNSIDNRLQASDLLVKGEGTLASFMNDICQKPFVEFFGDTYGDKYVFVAREQPFTGKAITDYINKYNLIEIHSHEVESQNLMWETEYYTWYQIQPNNNFLGFDSVTALGYLPIVYFPQMAENFGNHRYMISDSYINERALSGDQKNDAVADKFREAIIRDLKYVIDCNDYLPFTRKGSITIEGDRRIKKGTFIYYKPTNEIFYVEGVSQKFSASMRGIDRTTTLNVSRGMIKDYVIWKDNFKENDISYFNVVDTNKIYETLVNVIDTESEEDKESTKFKNQQLTAKVNYGINQEVFDFFFKRKQFD
jgi:hypothetical protein